MATTTETARSASMRAKQAKAIANGVSLASPLLYVITIGLDRSAKGQQISQEGWRNVLWGEASGLNYSWRIIKTRSSATVNTGEAGTRTFEAVDLLDTATVSYYNVEKTAMLAPRDKDLNKDDDTRLDNIWKRRVEDARDAIWSELAQIPWNENATNQNAGLSAIGPTEVASGASYPYAGISIVSTNTHWTPPHYHYGSPLSLTSNLVPIVAEVERRLTVSENPGGGGRRISPDFGACDPTLWSYLYQYVESKLSFNVNGGSLPANANMFENGFRNFQICGITIFYDEYYGGDTGSIEGGATDEIMFGHSKKMKFATSASRATGFIRSIQEEESPVIAADVGVFKTGMFCFFMESPKFFALAYT